MPHINARFCWRHRFSYENRSHEFRSRHNHPFLSMGKGYNNLHGSEGKFVRIAHLRTSLPSTRLACDCGRSLLRGRRAFVRFNQWPVIPPTMTTPYIGRYHPAHSFYRKAHRSVPCFINVHICSKLMGFFAVRICMGFSKARLTLKRSD